MKPFSSLAMIELQLDNIKTYDEYTTAFYEDLMPLFKCVFEAI